MALQSLISSARNVKLLTNVPLRFFVTSLPADARGRVNWNFIAQETEERTKLILSDRRKLKNVYTPPKFTKNISQLFKFFPLSPDKVENILLNHTEILDCDAKQVIEIVKILVEAGDYDIITQEEALLCVARYPELVKLDPGKFKENVSNIFGVSAIYDIPWNMVLTDSPSTLTDSPSHVGFIVESLSSWFSEERVRDVVGNNPTIFEMSWHQIEEKLRYLQFTMNVSAYRIAMTPKSLTHDLEYFKLRFEFLSRSGHYRHPDPSAKSAVVAEASPLLHLITDTADERFLNKCCPGITMEEFNVFRTLKVLEDQENQENNEEDDDDHIEGDENRYTVKTKNREKIKYDPDRFRFRK